MPGHRKPGMPGHRAPATGRSPSTGQMGEKEISSLPVAGHRPSSLRSLELDRLNSREIQESPSTQHSRSPSNRPPGMPGHRATIHRAPDSRLYLRILLVILTPLVLSSLANNKVHLRYFFPWNQTSVTCPTPVL